MKEQLNANEAPEFSPRCDSGETVWCKAEVTGIETFYMHCLDCGEDWGQE